MSKNIRVPTFKNAVKRAMQYRKLSEVKVSEPRVCQTGPLKEVLDTLPTQTARINERTLAQSKSQSLLTSPLITIGKRPSVMPNMRLRNANVLDGSPLNVSANVMGTVQTYTSDSLRKKSQHVYNQAVARRRAEDAQREKMIPQVAKSRLTQRLMNFLRSDTSGPVRPGQITYNSQQPTPGQQSESIADDTATAVVMLQQQEKFLQDAKAARMAWKHETPLPAARETAVKPEESIKYDFQRKPIADTATAVIMRRRSRETLRSQVAWVQGGVAAANKDGEANEGGDDNDDNDGSSKDDNTNATVDDNNGKHTLRADHKNVSPRNPAKRGTLAKICAQIRTQESISARWRRLTLLNRY